MTTNFISKSTAESIAQGLNNLSDDPIVRGMLKSFSDFMSFINNLSNTASYVKTTVEARGKLDKFVELMPESTLRDALNQMADIAFENNGDYKTSEVLRDLTKNPYTSKEKLLEAYEAVDGKFTCEQLKDVLDKAIDNTFENGANITAAAKEALNAIELPDAEQIMENDADMDLDE